MTDRKRRGLITRLRNAADKLDEEAALMRHRLEIDNAQRSWFAEVAGKMRDAADKLEPR